MSEYTKLSDKGNKVEFDPEEDMYWGPTPELRKLWLTNSLKIQLANTSSSPETIEEGEGEGIAMCNVVNSRLIEKSENKQVKVTDEEKKQTLQHALNSGIAGTPGLLIALVLNLFLSMSFGQAFFPTSWTFPDSVPRAIGVQMFLFSTLICQLVMTKMSKFPSAMGMMMVENIPFMHIIASTCVDAQGPGIDTFSTVFVTFSLSTIAVGCAFYLLGKFKIGNAMYFFPRHVIIGCIGGIGIFIMQTGVEVSSNRPWVWSLASIRLFFGGSALLHWGASLLFVVLLRLILFIVNVPLLPPFYFICIPAAFFALYTLLGYTTHQVRSNDWYFPEAESVDPLLIWELIDINTVNWVAVGNCVPTIIALCIFRYLKFSSFALKYSAYPADLSNFLICD